MSDLPIRKLNRLKTYDYSSCGSYFLTLCVKDMKCILSRVVGVDAPGDPVPQIILTRYGCIADSVIKRNESVYDDITVDKYVIMPNHIHLLISVNAAENSDGALRASPPTNRVSVFVSALKKFSSQKAGIDLWQRNYYDYIIRDDDDFLVRWQYIDENPRKWLIGKDEYYS